MQDKSGPDQGHTAEPPEEIDQADQNVDSGHETETHQAVETSAPDVEARARDMGWRPKTEWRGDPAQWKSAEEFVRRGEEIVPIIRSRLEKSNARVMELEGTLSRKDTEYAERFKRLEGMTQVALKKQRDQLFASFESEKRKAVEAGDIKEYDRLSAEQHDSMSEFNTEMQRAQAAPKPETQGQAQVRDPEKERAAQAWIAKQDWWNVDETMTEMATAYHGRLLKQRPGMDINENLEEVDRFMRRSFPDKYAKPAPSSQQQQGNGQRQQTSQHAPSFEGGGRQAGATGRHAKGWGDLPPEAKTAGEKFIGQGLYANDAKGRAEYATDYFSQE